MPLHLSLAGSRDCYRRVVLMDILRMFAGQGAANPAIQQALSGRFVQNLINKFGLNEIQAGEVADQVVPNVVNDLVSKTNDPSDNGFNIQDIFNSVSGGQTSGFNMQALLNKVKGGKLDLDGDEDTDLKDLIVLFKGGSSGASIMNQAKGLFG